MDPACEGLYNKNSRGYPNISASGFHLITTWNGTDLWLDGTSASTPAASAILSLVNDALISAGKPPLGFLNPWLYKEVGKRSQISRLGVHWAVVWRVSRRGRDGMQ